MLVLSALARSARSRLQPSMRHARAFAGGTFAVAAFAVAAFAAFAVAALCLSLQCAPPVVTACRRSQCCAAVLRRQRLAACPLDAAVPACRTRHAEPHAPFRFGGNGAAMAGKAKSHVLSTLTLSGSSFNRFEMPCSLYRGSRNPEPYGTSRYGSWLWGDRWAPGGL